MKESFSLFTKFLILPITLLSLICAAVVLVAHRNEDSMGNLLFPLALGISGVMAFSLVMGIVNEIGFPTLKYPGSYNRLGFYPLHFLLFVCGISFLLMVRQFKKHERN